MDSLASHNPAAFTPNKTISANVLFSQEMLKDYHKDKSQPSCAIIVELMKAVKSLNWVVHSSLPSRFGAPSK